MAYPLPVQLPSSARVSRSFFVKKCAPTKRPIKLPVFRQHRPEADKIDKKNKLPRLTPVCDNIFLSGKACKADRQI